MLTYHSLIWYFILVALILSSRLALLHRVLVGFVNIFGLALLFHHSPGGALHLIPGGRRHHSGALYGYLYGNGHLEFASFLYLPLLEFADKLVLWSSRIFGSFWYTFGHFAKNKHVSTLVPLLVYI